MNRYWKNIAGSFSIEFERDDSGWHDITHDDQQIPDALLLTLNNFPDCERYVEVIVYFLSSGFHQEKSMYGGPDHLGWPEDGSDERRVTLVGFKRDVGSSLIRGPLFLHSMETDYEKDLYKSEIIIDDDGE